MISSFGPAEDRAYGMFGEGEVEQEIFGALRRHEDRRRRDVFLQLLQCLIALIHPFEASPTCPDGLEERPTHIRRFDDKSVQGRRHTSEPLDFFDGCRRSETGYRSDLIRISFNPTAGHKESQELARADSEDTFICVELELMLI